jgi:riboflavin kinase / FMN adenylyltransferase
MPVMRLYRSLDSLAALDAGEPRVVTIGVFDGLHIGHQEILRRTLAAAVASGEAAMVCSFEPMPSEFFAKGDPPARLTCFRERIELLADCGVTELFCPRFGAIRGLGPDDFVTELLVGRLNVSRVVVGHDFRYGAGRAGSVATLRAAGERHGFTVSEVEPVFSNGRRVSSTAIREFLGAGDLASARVMLGRDYAMSGRVVHGLGLGKQLGFPTANVNLKRRIAPIDGIFAVRVSGLGAGLRDGVASVGNRPTVGGGKTLLEVYLFDFEREIYGEYITVHFIERLREERTFADLDALKRQMAIDARGARAALAG